MSLGLTNTHAAPEQVDTPGKKLLVGVAVTYLALVLLVPTLNVFVQAFAKGPGPFFGHLTDPDFLHAVRAVRTGSQSAVRVGKQGWSQGQSCSIKSASGRAFVSLAPLRFQAAWHALQTRQQKSAKHCRGNSTYTVRATRYRTAMPHSGLTLSRACTLCLRLPDRPCPVARSSYQHASTPKSIARVLCARSCR